MRTTTRWGAALAVTAAASLMLGACSSGSDDEPEATAEATGSDAPADDGELTPVKLQLQWLTQAQFAG